MKMFLLGDIHGAWGDADDAYNAARKRLGRPDILVQLGDYGYFPSSRSSGMWERYFDHPVAFIDGNHENHEAIRENCGWPTWEYLSRGTYRDNVLYVGGAASVDKEYRLRWGHYWSSLEELTCEEVTPIIDANHENVKVVISHTCPSSFDMSAYANPAFGRENKGEKTRVLLDEILRKYEPDYWFFGHWHRSGVGQEGRTKWQCLNINEIIYIDTDAICGKQ